MIQLDRYEKAFQSLPEGIARAEVNAERIRATEISVRNGKAVSSEAYDQTKYYLRAGDARLGMVYTERPDEDVEAILRLAGENSKLSQYAPVMPMRQGNDREEDVISAQPYEKVADMLELGIRAEMCLQGLTVHRLSVRLFERETRTLNTQGFDACSRTYWAEIHAMVAMHRENMQDAEAEVALSAQNLSVLSPQALGVKARQACERYDGFGAPPVSVVPGRYPCVMTGQVMRNILMTAWRAFSAEAMQSGRSCLAGADRQIGSGCVQLIHAPSHPGTGKVWPLDSEGTRIRKTVVVQNGQLVEPLYTMASAYKDARKSNGCAGRVPVMTGNTPIALTTVPGLIYLAPGAASLDDLIARMESGIVLTYSLDLYHSVNVASGLFSVPCGGYRVENGIITGSVSQLTVAGDLRELFSAVEEVADDLDFDDFYFRNYCVGSPSVRLHSLSFAS